MVNQTEKNLDILRKLKIADETIKLLENNPQELNRLMEKMLYEAEQYHLNKLFQYDGNKHHQEIYDSAKKALDYVKKQHKI